MKKNPGMSIASFVEYAFSSPQRRASIIESAIKTPLFLVDTRYPEIERALGADLASGSNSFQRMRDLDRSLQQREARSDHDESRILNALDAIELASQINWAPKIGSCYLLKSEIDSSFEIEGFEIRVRPTAIVSTVEHRDRSRKIGVQKAYFSKGNPLHKMHNEAPALYATTVHLYTLNALSHLGEIELGLTRVTDVFAKKHYSAPVRFIQREKQIRALCTEIVDRWYHISERLEDKDIIRAAFR